jgi:RNA polymerase sigma-70 factor (ECF subfamily)
VIAVYEDPEAVKPSYLMWLEWADGRISFIRDYRYVRYVIDDAELVLAPDAAPPGAQQIAHPPRDRPHQRTFGASS